MTLTSLALLVLAPQVTIYESEPNDLCTQVNVVNYTTDLELVGQLLGGDVDRFEVVIPPGLPGPLFITLLDVPGAEVVAELAPSCGAAGDAIADGLGRAIAPDWPPYNGRLHIAVSSQTALTQPTPYTVRVAFDPCVAFVPDAAEPDDLFAQAAPAYLPPQLSGAGSLARRTFVAGDVDHFAISIPPDTSVRYALPKAWDVAHDPLLIELLDPVSGAVLGVGVGVLEFQPVLAWRSFVLRVAASPQADCVGYELWAVWQGGPCGRSLQDALEGPDDFGTAAPMPAGKYDSLTVNEVDPDAHAVMIAPGEAVDLRLRVSGPSGAEVMLDTQVGNGPIESTFVILGDTRRLLVNPHGVPVVAHIGVRSLSRCAGYSLELVDLGVGPAGASVCAGLSTSGAPPAVAVFPGVVGSRGELLLRLDGLVGPTAAFGYHAVAVIGTSYSAPPGGAGGLCVRGNTARSPQVLVNDRVSFVLDVSALQNAAFLTSGQSMTVQVWYQNLLAGSADAGVSNAVQVLIP